MRASWLPNEEIPVESEVYRDIEALATSYGTPQGYLSTRPWTRADLAGFLAAVESRDSTSARDPAFVRLWRETPDAAGKGAWAPLLTHEEGGRRLELSPYARLGYIEDARGDIIRDHRIGGRFGLALGAHGLLAADLYAGTHSPGGHGNPANSRQFAVVEGMDINSYYDRAMARVDGRYGRVTLGHTWLHWGPGRSGTLALSDAAPALDLLEFRVPLLHRIRFDWFVAVLDPVAETYLAGKRLEARPWDGLEIGVAEHARFDGFSSAPLYAIPFVPYAHLEKRNLADSEVPVDTSNSARFKNNVMWSADLAWRIVPGVRVWGELVVDDVSFSSTWRPNATGWQAGGAWRTRAAGGRPLEVWGEYSRVYRYTYSVWHQHDFAFAGLPLGYLHGPDVEHLEGALSLDLNSDLTVAVDGLMTRKGELTLGDAWQTTDGRVEDTALSGVVERTTEGGISVAWTPARGLRARARVGHADVQAADHVTGAHESHTTMLMRLDASW